MSTRSGPRAQVAASSSAAPPRCERSISPYRLTPRLHRFPPLERTVPHLGGIGRVDLWLTAPRDSRAYAARRTDSARGAGSARSAFAGWRRDSAARGARRFLLPPCVPTAASRGLREGRSFGSSLSTTIPADERNRSATATDRTPSRGGRCNRRSTRAVLRDARSPCRRAPPHGRGRRPASAARGGTPGRGRTRERRAFAAGPRPPPPRRPR